MLGIDSGLCALHRAKIAHCDIKLENILLDSSYSPRVADFGLADSGRGAGTTSYKAPEHWDIKLKFDQYLADAWSFGVLCYRLLEDQHFLTQQ